jgi:hypothetical protein
VYDLSPTPELKISESSGDSHESRRAKIARIIGSRNEFLIQISDDLGDSRGKKPTGTLEAKTINMLSFLISPDEIRSHLISAYKSLR